MTRLRTLTATVACCAGLVLAGCGSSSSPATDSTPAANTVSSDTTPTGASTAGAVTAGKVSANTASGDELVAALEAAGVPSADRWAREIQEYRPYDSSDPTLASLRSELSKYNPSSEVLEKIIGVLAP